MGGCGRNVNYFPNPNTSSQFFFMYANMDPNDSNNLLDIEEEDLIVQAAATAAIGAAIAVLNYTQAYYDKTPYHNSALTGAAWVVELLTGHPEHICNELGVHKHIFQALIAALQDAGYMHSKHITLEEQLAIFLYICITGLSLVHMCKHFQ